MNKPLKNGFLNGSSSRCSTTLPMSPNPSFIENEEDIDNNCDKNIIEHGQVYLKVKLFEINTTAIQECFREVDKNRSLNHDENDFVRESMSD